MNEQYSVMDLLGNNQRQPAFIRFKNNTHYVVEIIWINVDNKEKTYNFLAPKEFLDVNTYSTHPWIFRECISKSNMVVDAKEVFIAKSWIEEHRRLEFNHPINIPLRTLVSIEMPLLDLRQLCLLKLATILKSKDDVTSLEIPVVLQKELIQMVSNKEISKIKFT